MLGWGDSDVDAFKSPMLLELNTKTYQFIVALVVLLFGLWSVSCLRCVDVCLLLPRINATQ